MPVDQRSAQIDAVAADVFLDWLNAAADRKYELDESDGRLLAADGERAMQISVAPLFDVQGDEAWNRRCSAVSKQIEAQATAPIALWVPPSADLPHGDRSEFIERILDAAVPLEPGQRGQVEFTVTLTLKKTSTEASYVQVSGGLAPHWAKLTGRAYGQYLLDTTPIHRLPEPESRVADLLDWVALLGNGMKAGVSSEFKAEDAWTLTRPRRGASCTLIGAAPDIDPTNGTTVRKLLRSGITSASTQSDSDDAPRALVLVGVFRSIEEETATIALRGCDPALYAGFDVICLVADGHCKALFGPHSDRI